MLCVWGRGVLCCQPTHAPLVVSRKEKEKDDADGEGGEEGAVTSTAPSGGGAGGAAASAGGDKEKDESGKFDDSSAQPFGAWFTWCQACRHGGHATHITEWFKTHVECPVTDCSCVCMSLDQAAPPASDQMAHEL